jgi:hypothetical protein
LLRFSIVLLLAACASGAPAPEPSGPSIERPDVKVGERWTYRQRDAFTNAQISVSEIRVVRIDADGIHAANGRWTLEWNETGQQAEEFVTPHDGSLRFPLRAGATYPVAYDVRRAFLGSRLPFNGRARALGWEEVTVPAGSFRALKVEVDVKAARASHPGLNVLLRKTIWYSPAVKRWVKFSYDERIYGTTLDIRWTSELVDYQLN